jgi:four helix bundle protein
MMVVVRPGRAMFGDTTIHSMGDFKKLIAWQKAHAYVLAVHAAYKGTNTRAAPGMRGQILRAVNSISATLAEGCAKRSRADLARFADMAYASAKEVENHLITSRDLGILSSNLTADLLRQGDEVSRLCFALARPARDSTSARSRSV